MRTSYPLMFSIPFFKSSHIFLQVEGRVRNGTLNLLQC